MAEDSEVFVDWLVCCGCENDAAKFVKSGIDSIKKVRNFQFKKIEPSGWMNENFCRLKDRTRTEEELSQEVSVSVCVCVCVCVSDHRYSNGERLETVRLLQSLK